MTLKLCVQNWKLILQVLYIDTNSTNMKLYFDTNDGLSDSIKLCLSKYNNFTIKICL
jgi:hypothetical protein